MHYAAVLLVYPRLGRGPAPVPWPRRRAAAIAVAAAGLALVFAVDYRTARQLYGLAALVHAWIEIPLLLLLLGGWAGAQKRIA